MRVNQNALAFVETSITYHCSVPSCGVSERVPLAPGQAESWAPTFEYAREYLPSRWVMVYGRPLSGHRVTIVGATGSVSVVALRSWLFCSTLCLVEFTDRTHENGITRVMTGD